MNKISLVWNTDKDFTLLCYIHMPGLDNSFLFELLNYFSTKAFST